MVAPVTGPFSESITLKGPPTSLGFKPQHFHRSRTWWRQKRPYTLPLAWSMVRSRVTRHSSVDGRSFKHYFQCLSYNTTFESVHDSVYARAYSDFVSKLKSDSSEMLVNLAERKQAVSMIGNRALQLAAAAILIKKGRFRQAWTRLSKKPIPRRIKSLTRRDAKKVGDVWLEYHLGWSPLVSDIHSATAVLMNGVPPTRIKARAKHTFKEVSVVGSGYTYKVSTVESTYGIVLGADVYVSNPNVALANQLGLINPAGLAWELVPFSFVLDWFGTIGDVINSYTDFAGFTLTNQFTTTWSVCSSTEAYTLDPNREMWAGETVRVIRSPGAIPGPRLTLKMPKALSVTRGATAIALLLQQLRS